MEGRGAFVFDNLGRFEGARAGCAFVGDNLGRFEGARAELSAKWGCAFVFDNLGRFEGARVEGRSYGPTWDRYEQAFVPYWGRFAREMVERSARRAGRTLAYCEAPSREA